jgi:hypothetical protein
LIVALALACGEERTSAPTKAAVEVAPAKPVPGGPVRTDPWTPASADDERAAVAVLERVVRIEALASDDETWMLAHAIAPLGRDATTKAGTNVVDAILARASVEGSAPVFTGESASGTLRDPHPDHTLAALVSAGVPGTHAFAVGDARFTVADLYAHARARFERPTSWAEHAWTLHAMADAVTVGLPEAASFDGVALARAAAASIVADMQFLADARRDGTAVRKRGQGVWSQPCGGLHGIEAVAAWLALREDEALRTELERIVDVLAYRVGVEADLYAWMRAQAPPDIVVKLDAQELKFFGHVLDAADELAAAKMPLPPDVLAEARARLVAAVLRIERGGMLAELARVRSSDPQLYRDLVGDSAHALVGLDRA